SKTTTTTSTTTHSLHDALPIYPRNRRPKDRTRTRPDKPCKHQVPKLKCSTRRTSEPRSRFLSRTRKSYRRQDPKEWSAKLRLHGDRKSTRLNSSHVKISYAVFC